MAHTDTRSEQIAGELVEEILRGRYAPGDRLPSERELAARFSASRGAVREAVKRMENLGVIAVHPGGARIVPIEQATLEILGPMLDLESPPNPQLVDHVLTVMGALMEMAARAAVVRASDAQIAAARALVARIRQPDIDHSERVNARIEIARLFMAASGNLVLQLISNSLRLQFESRLDKPPAGPDVNTPEYVQLIERLDSGLANRDPDSVHAALQTIFEMNRKSVVSALQRASAETTHTKELAWSQAAGG